MENFRENGKMTVLAPVFKFNPICICFIFTLLSHIPGVADRAHRTPLVNSGK